MFPIDGGTNYINLVASVGTDVFPYRSRGHKSAWVCKPAFLLYAVGKNLIPCLFQFPEATCIPRLLVPSFIFRVHLSSLCFLVHLFSHSDPPTSLFKALVGYLGSTRRIRANLSISGSLSYHICKSFLSHEIIFSEVLGIRMYSAYHDDPRKFDNSLQILEGLTCRRWRKD